MEAPGELVFEEEAIQESVGAGWCTRMVGVAVETSFPANSQLRSSMVFLFLLKNSEALSTVGKEGEKKKKSPRVKNVPLLAGKVHGAGSSPFPQPANQSAGSLGVQQK